MGWCYPSSSNEKGLAEVKQNHARHCTDVLCLLLFVVFWGTIFFVVGHSRAQGADPDRILRGSNLEGQICGKTNPDLQNNLAAWPNPAYYSSIICVASCDLTSTSAEHFFMNYESRAFLHRCIPSESVDAKISFSGEFNGDLGTRTFADIWVVKYEILASAFLAIILSMVYLAFIKRCAGLLVWVSIGFVILGGFILGYTLLQSGHDISSSVNQDGRAKALHITGWIFVVGTAIVVLVTFFMRKQIALSIKMVEIATLVVNDLPLLFVFPLFVGVVFAFYIFLWMILSVYVFSVGNAVSQATPTLVWQHLDGTDNGNPHTMEAYVFDKNYRDYVIPHFFGLFWNTQFLLYFGYMVVASCSADWYFSMSDVNGKKVRGDGPSELSNFAILESTHRVFRYHLGSIAFGSLLIAIIKTLRAIITYLQKKTSSANPNILQKAIFCLLQCVLKCVECCIDKINKTAFVYIAVYGSNFCSAAGQSFSLLMRNLASVAILDRVGAYLILLGKVMVTLLTTGVFAMVFRSYFEVSISSPVMPCIVTAAFAYTISSLFMVVFETIIDTLFVCFMIDLDHNSGGNMMAPDDLQRLVNEHSDDSKQAAQEHLLMKARFKGDDESQSQPLSY